MDEFRPLRVLIAEDSPPDRLILESIIKKAGHEVISTCDGQQALDAFQEQLPDIVLLDVVMPNMDGLQAIRHMRKHTLGQLVPIIFLTSLTDTKSIIECLEVGGDDFIPKPFNAVVLQSKIKAFGRMRDMHLTVTSQRDEIKKHHNHLIQEQRVAKQVFDKIAHTGMLDIDNIRYSMSPLAVFNGDILVAEVSPNGNLIILLGDFTGHGLPAAVGSMPLASTFYGMVKKGFSLPDVLREINTKLNQILPVGFFCCATCVEINFNEKTLFTWTGGLPPSYLYRTNTDEYEILQSSNLPLGVLNQSSFKADPTRIELEDGDRLYMWSDGIFESRNSQGEMFGEQRLDAFMHQHKGEEKLFITLLSEVQKHIGKSEKDDDISLIEIKIQDIDLKPEVDNSMLGSSGIKDWNMAFKLHANSLQQFDPLPLLINIISQVPGLQKNSTTLYTVLAELYANALEHGVLKLDSADKSDPQGFTEFYVKRKERLSELTEGFVGFEFTHVETSNGGLLTIDVCDSGDGYDFESRVIDQQSSGSINDSYQYHGRGLNLLHSICEKVVVHKPGNHIEVHYRWVR